MRAYVLHLARATARRHNAQELLHTCGLEGEIWPAVDGAAMSLEERSTYIRPMLFQPRYPFPLNPGEIGCFLSHRQIWADIVRRNLDAALIIEDDVKIEETQFDIALKLALKHILDLGYIKFQTCAPKGQFSTIEYQSGISLVRPIEPGLGAIAQIVSAPAARKLLERTQKFDRPIDTLVQSFWHTGLQPSVIYPSGAYHADNTLGGTTIQNSTQSTWQKLRREFKRARYRIAAKKLSRRYHLLD